MEFMALLFFKGGLQSLKILTNWRDIWIQMNRNLPYVFSTFFPISGVSKKIAALEKNA